MNRIKLLSVVLVLGLAGALHAAARTQDATRASATASADKPSCCKAHMADDKQAQGQSCDTRDCCCKSHSMKTEAGAKTSADDCCACCGHDKKDARANMVKTDGAQMSCDASGGCCESCDCCKDHKAHSASAGNDKSAGHGCCADCSCCAARQAVAHANS